MSEIQKDEMLYRESYVKRLEQELESAKKDQARYQWLRSPDNQWHEDLPCVSDAFFNTYFLEDLDKEIDKYISIKESSK